MVVAVVVRLLVLGVVGFLVLLFVVVVACFVFVCCVSLKVWSSQVRKSSRVGCGVGSREFSSCERRDGRVVWQRCSVVFGSSLR